MLHVTGSFVLLLVYGVKRLVVLCFLLSLFSVVTDVLCVFAKCAEPAKFKLH